MDWTFFRVPSSLRAVHKKCYKPHCVSMGLYDRDLKNLCSSPVDHCRLDYARAFLNAFGNGPDDGETESSAWKVICQAVVQNPAKQKQRYETDMFEHMSDDVVRYLLTLDAIFLACHLMQTYLHFTFLKREVLRNSTLGMLWKVYCKLDSLGVSELVDEDFFLLENQIAFELLREVVKIMLPKIEPLILDKIGHTEDEVLGNIATAALRRWISHVPGGNELEKLFFGYNITRSFYAEGDAHLLHGLHRLATASNFRFVPHAMPRSVEGRTRSPDNKNQARAATLNKRKSKRVRILREDSTIPTATTLRREGIHFKPAVLGVTDVIFEPGFFSGTLCLPQLYIWDNTEHLLRNLAAYEIMLCYKDPENVSHLAWYFVLMDFLINREEDVTILIDSNVLVVNAMGDERAIARMWNRMATGYFLAPNVRMIELLEEINEHRKRIRMRRLLLELWEKYFGKPWLVISAIAAVVLLTLTLLQTVYTVLGFYNNGSVTARTQTP